MDLSDSDLSDVNILYDLSQLSTLGYFAPKENKFVAFHQALVLILEYLLVR